MQLQAVFISLLTSATAISVSFDPAYDDALRSLTTVACSDGSNGLITKGYTTLGSLPSFPRIGGASTIAGWNSANCGACYSLTFEGKTINVLVVDVAGEGFNIGQTAMDELTNGQAVAKGRVDAAWTEAPGGCGL